MANRRRLDFLFDLRVIIAVLFSVYGIVCLVWGLAFDGPTDRAKSGNVNVNVWTGAAMLVFAVAFAAWALARPLARPDDETDSGTDEADSEAAGR